MTDKIQFSFRSSLKMQAKETSVYTLATFLPQVATFLLLPLFWQKFTPTDFGIIAVTEMIGSFITIFMGLSLEISISRLYYEWPEDQRKRRLGAIWVISWLSSIIIGAVSIFIMPFIAPILFPGVEFYPYIFLGLVNTILTSFTVVVFMTIRIKRLPWLYSLYTVTTVLMLLMLNIYFVLILDKGLYGYFISNLIGRSIAVLGCVVIMSFFAVPCIRGVKIKDSLKFSLPLIPTNIISTGTGIADKFILQRVVSLEALGIYYLCLKFTSLINSLHTTLKLSYIPFMSKTAAEQKQEQNSLILARMGTFYVLPLILVAMAVSIYLKDFVYIVNKPKYFPIISYVPLFMGPAVIMNFTNYLVPGLFLAKRTDLMWVPAVVQFITIVICSLVLIPLFKLNGVVISRYLNSIVFMGVSYFFTRKFYPIPVQWSKIILLLALASLAIIVSAQIGFSSHLINIFIKTLIITVVSLLCVITLTGFLKLKKSVIARIKAA